jgi:pilus assembly protein CpaB
VGGDWRKLLSTRRGTAIVAAVCTVVAAGILLFAASRYRSSVDAGGRPAAVFVANSVIQKGTPGDVIASQQMFRTETVAGKQLATGAIADAAALHGKVAAIDINPGQQLTAADFTVGSGIAAQLAPTQRAMSIPLDTSHGLSGILHAGDRVDIYAGLNLSATNLGGGQARAALRLLIPNVPVLQVGVNGGSGGLGAGQGVNQQADIVLKVNATDAGALAFASDAGKVWLVLRGANAVEPTSQAQTVYSINTLLQGGNAVAAGGRP